MNSFKIRRANFCDIDGLYDVETRSFATPWSRAAFEVELQDNDLAYYLVMEDKGRVIGYAGMWIIVDEAHITNIAVLSECRGQGLGEILLKAMITAAKDRGAVSMTLEVRPSNLSALSLYEKLGFINKGIRKQYYTDNKEDALIMWLDQL